MGNKKERSRDRIRGQMFKAPTNEQANRVTLLLEQLQNERGVNSDPKSNYGSTQPQTENK